MNSKESKLFFWGVIPILLIVFIGILIQSGYFSKKNYKPGDTVKEFEFFLGEKRVLKIEKGSWYLFIVLDNLKKNFSFIKYINSLYINTYKGQNLKVVFFNEADESTIKIYSNENNISLPILPVYNNLKVLKRLFNSLKDPKSILFIEPSLRVGFTSNFIKEDDVRQLLEKFLLGSIQYRGLRKTRLKINDPFPALEILNLKNAEENIINKDIKFNLWFVFSSNCVSCALKSHLMTYSILENSLLNSLSISKGLLFSSFFNIQEIYNRLEELNIQTPAYIAKNELAGIEDIYYKKSNENVLVIIVNSNHIVTYIKPFGEFISHLKGGYFEEKKHLYQ